MKRWPKPIKINCCTRNFSLNTLPIPTPIKRGTPNFFCYEYGYLPWRMIGFDCEEEGGVKISHTKH